jgi:hypothetical protein
LEQLVVEEDATKWTGDFTDAPLPGLEMVTPAKAEGTRRRASTERQAGKNSFRMKTTPVMNCDVVAMTAIRGFYGDFFFELKEIR